MIYTHVLNRGGRGVRSPLDAAPLPDASSGLSRGLHRPRTPPNMDPRSPSEGP
jgi:hypothetical protein